MTVEWAFHTYRGRWVHRVHHVALSCFYRSPERTKQIPVVKRALNLKYWTFKFKVRFRLKASVCFKLNADGAQLLHLLKQTERRSLFWCLHAQLRCRIDTWAFFHSLNNYLIAFRVISIFKLFLTFYLDVKCCYSEHQWRLLLLNVVRCVFQAYGYCWILVLTCPCDG